MSKVAQSQQQREQIIKHFSHPHPLQLRKLRPQHTLTCCGCELEVAGLVYTCTLCGYFLHISCSKLPQHMTHPFDRRNHVLSLRATPESPARGCDACGMRCTGLSYYCGPCDIDLHPLCATKPLAIAHQSHPHQLNLTFSPPYHTKQFFCDVCNMPGSNWLYRCNHCDFDVHLGCTSAKDQPTALNPRRSQQAAPPPRNQAVKNQAAPPPRNQAVKNQAAPPPRNQAVKNQAAPPPTGNQVFQHQAGGAPTMMNFLAGQVIQGTVQSVLAGGGHGGLFGGSVGDPSAGGGGGHGGLLSSGGDGGWGGDLAVDGGAYDSLFESGGDGGWVSDPAAVDGGAYDCLFDNGGDGGWGGDLADVDGGDNGGLLDSGGDGGWGGDPADDDDDLEAGVADDDDGGGGGGASGLISAIFDLWSN